MNKANYLLHVKRDENMSIKYQPIDEKTFVAQFVTPYAFYMRYDSKVGYWHKDDLHKYHPIFNFVVDDSKDPLEPWGKGDIHLSIPDNTSIVIPLDGQKDTRERGHFLYIGFGYNDMFYPVGPLCLNHQNKGDVCNIIANGHDNCIPMPLQIKHDIPDGVYYSEGITSRYYRGVKRWEHDDNIREYYQNGSLVSIVSPTMEMTFTEGFLSEHKNGKGGSSEIHRGQLHGATIYGPCNATFNEGFLHGNLTYENTHLFSSYLLSPYTDTKKLIGKIRIIAHARPKSVHVPIPCIWETDSLRCALRYGGIKIIGFNPISDIILRPSYFIGNFIVYHDEVEIIRYRLDMNGNFHGKQDLSRESTAYYWDGILHTKEKYETRVQCIHNTFIPELSDIILSYL